LIHRVLGNETPGKHGAVVPDRAQYAAGHQDLGEDQLEIGLSRKSLLDVPVDEWDTKSRPDRPENRGCQEPVHIEARNGVGQKPVGLRTSAAHWQLYLFPFRSLADIDIDRVQGRDGNRLF